MTSARSRLRDRDDSDLVDDLVCWLLSPPQQAHRCARAGEKALRELQRRGRGCSPRCTCSSCCGEFYVVDELSG